MRIDDFTANKTGHLVDFETGQGVRRYAFIPEELPGSWRMAERLWPLVAEANRLVGSLERIGAILPDPTLLLNPLQRREADRSSRLEGTFAAPNDFLFLEATSKRGARSIAGVPDPQALEVLNYRHALENGNNALRRHGAPLGRGLIEDLHRTLMTGVRGGDDNPGVVRSVPARIGRPTRFIPALPEYLDELLTNLDTFMSSEWSDVNIDPLVAAFMVHYQFEAIHPFEDGNGRVGRLLLSLCISEWLGSTHPWLYMSEFFDANKEEYFSRLYKVSTNGEWDEWIEFCLDGVKWQCDRSISRCDLIARVRKEYDKKVRRRDVRLRKLVESLLERPLLIIQDVVQITGRSKETARKDLQRLVDVGILEVIEGSRPRRYIARKLIEAAFGDGAIDFSEIRRRERPPIRTSAEKALRASGGRRRRLWPR